MGKTIDWIVPALLIIYGTVALVDGMFMDAGFGTTFIGGMFLLIGTFWGYIVYEDELYAH